MGTVFKQFAGFCWEASEIGTVMDGPISPNSCLFFFFHFINMALSKLLSFSYKFKNIFLKLQKLDNIQLQDVSSELL